MLKSIIKTTIQYTLTIVLISISVYFLIDSSIQQMKLRTAKKKIKYSEDDEDQLKEISKLKNDFKRLLKKLIFNDEVKKDIEAFEQLNLLLNEMVGTYHIQSIIEYSKVLERIYEKFVPQNNPKNLIK